MSAAAPPTSSAPREGVDVSGSCTHVQPAALCYATCSCAVGKRHAALACTQSALAGCIANQRRDTLVDCRTFPHLPCYAPLPIDTRSVVYKGAKCGPRGSLIKWTAFYIPNASDGKLKCGTRPLAKGRDMYNRVTFGSCGVPPAPAGVLPHRVCGSCDSDGSCTDAGPVAPPGRAGWLTRYPVVPGELVLPGMTRIRADRGWLTAGYSLSDVVVVVSASV